MTPCHHSSLTLHNAGEPRSPFGPQVTLHRSCQIGSCVSVSCYIYCPLVSLPLCLIYQRSAPWDYIITNITTTLTFNIIPKPSLLLTVRQLSCIVSEKLALAGSRTRVSKGIRPGVLTTRPPVPGRHNSASAHSQFFSLRLPDSAADTVQCQQC